MPATGGRPLHIVREINRRWQERCIQAMAAYLHPDIVMVLPGFAGRIQGVDAILESYRDYVDHAAPVRYQGSGEPWVFENTEEGWKAV